MKTLFYITAFIFVILFTYSCNKDRYGLFVRSGDKAFNSYYQLFDDVKTSIDVNKDGSADFELEIYPIDTAQSFQYFEIKLKNLDTTSFALAKYPKPLLYGGIETVKIFEEGEIVNELEMWDSRSEMRVSYMKNPPPSWEGENLYAKWIGKIGYVGIRYSKGKSFKYGWIKLTVPSATEAYFLGSALLR